MQTTAAKLVAYRAELTKGGVDSAVADEMVRDAGQYLLSNYGLAVQADDQAPTTGG